MTIPNKKDNQTLIIDVRQFVPLEEAESYLLCLNQNTWLVVQMLHSFYASWRNRYSQNVEVEELLQPDDTQYRLILDTFNQGELELSQVTCLTDLIEALGQINTTLAEKNMSPVVNVETNCGGCGGCNGTGQVIDQEPNPGQPDTPGGGPGGYPPPEDWDEEISGNYSDYKCKAANMIYDSISTTLNYVGGLYTAAGAIAAGAALGSWLLASVAAYSPIGVIGVSIFAVLTAWEVGLIVGLVATASLIAGGTILYVFIEAKEELETRKEEFVCALYTSGTVEGARDEASTILSECIDAMDLSTGPLAGFADTARNLMADVIGYFLPNTLLNKLFSDDDAVRDYAGGTVSCSTCEPGGYTIVIGNPMSLEGANPFTVELVYSTFSGTCGVDFKRGILVNFGTETTIVSITGVESEALCTGVFKYYLYAAEGGLGGAFYQNNLPPEDVPGVRSLAIITGGGGNPEATITFTQP